jgi:antitoxin HicB
VNVLSYPAVFTEEGESIDVSFPDFPRSHTSGKTREEAFRMAVDCLQATIEYALEDKESVPEPSRIKKGQYAIPVSLDLAPKLALFQIMRKQKISNVQLAKQLGVSEMIVRRMLDPRHVSKPAQYMRALAALGRVTQVSIINAPKAS